MWVPLRTKWLSVRLRTKWSWVRLQTKWLWVRFELNDCVFVYELTGWVLAYKLNGWVFVYELNGCGFVYELNGWVFVYGVNGWVFVYELNGWVLVYKLNGCGFVYELNGCGFVYELSGCPYFYKTKCLWVQIPLQSLNESSSFRYQSIWLHDKVNHGYRLLKLMKRNWSRLLVFITCPLDVYRFVCRDGKLRHINALISSSFNSCTMNYNHLHITVFSNHLKLHMYMDCVYF